MPAFIKSMLHTHVDMFAAIPLLLLHPPLPRQCAHQVGYFWLTNGLAFIPQDASALYIDVRLVPHCSDPSYVHNGDPTARVEYEGRYGE